MRKQPGDWWFEYAGYKTASWLDEADMRRAIAWGDSYIEKLFIAGMLSVGWVPGPGNSKTFANRRRYPTVTAHVQYAVTSGGNAYRLDVAFISDEAMLAVELDGYAYHSDREAFERDRRRDLHLSLDGWKTLRFGSAYLIGDPIDCARDVMTLLGRINPIAEYADVPNTEVPF